MKYPLEKPLFSRRQFLWVAGATGVVTLIQACAPAAPPAPAEQKAAAPAAPQPTVAPTPRPVVRVKVGVAPPRSVNQAMPHIGIDKGFYKEQGIDVEFVEIQSSPNSIKALIAGDLDLIDSNTAGIISSIVSGAPLKNLGSISKGLTTAIFVKKEIYSLQDLYGRTVAITGVGTLPHTVTLALLRQEKLDPEKINFLATGDQNTFLSLVAGKVDANASSIDDLPEAEKNPNIKMLVVAGEKLPNYVRTSIATRDNLIKEKEDVLVRFLIAYTQSHRYSLDHKDEIVDLSTKLNKRERSTNATIFDVYKNRRLIEPNLVLTPADIDYMQEVNILAKQQKEKVLVEKLLNTGIREKVIAAIGEYKFS